MTRLLIVACVFAAGCNTFSPLEEQTGDTGNQSDVDRVDARSDASNNQNNVNNIDPMDGGVDLSDRDVTTIDMNEADMRTYDPMCPPISNAVPTTPYDDDPNDDWTDITMLNQPSEFTSWDLAVTGTDVWATYVNNDPNIRMIYYEWTNGVEMSSPMFAAPANWTPTMRPFDFVSHKIADTSIFVTTGEYDGAMNLRALAFSATSLPALPVPGTIDWQSKQIAVSRTGDFGMKPAVAGGLVSGTAGSFWILIVVDEDGTQSIGRAREDETMLETFSLPNDQFGAGRMMISTHGSDAFTWNQGTQAIERLSLSNGVASFQNTNLTSRSRPAVTYVGDLCGDEVYAVAYDTGAGYQVQTTPYQRTEITIPDPTAHIRGQTVIPNPSAEQHYNTFVIGSIEPDPTGMAQMAAFRVFSVGQNSIDLIACRRRLIPAMTAAEVGDFTFEVRGANADLQVHMMYRNPMGTVFVWRGVFPDLDLNDRDRLIEASDPTCQDVFF